MRMQMKQDLFNPTKTKKQELLEFIKARHWVKTSQVIQFGQEHYYNRAEKTAREFAEGEHPKIKRMPKDEVMLRFGDIHEGVWVYCG